MGEWKPEKAGWRVRGRGGKIKKRWRWRGDARKEEIFFKLKDVVSSLGVYWEK